MPPTTPGIITIRNTKKAGFTYSSIAFTPFSCGTDLRHPKHTRERVRRKRSAHFDAAGARRPDLTVTFRLVYSIYHVFEEEIMTLGKRFGVTSGGLLPSGPCPVQTK